MAKQKVLFQFNLLPAKSEAEIVIEAERDDSLLYAMVLVFFALFAYVGLTMANSFLIAPRVEGIEGQIRGIQQNINSFQEIRSNNGELFVKTETLSEILKRDLAAEEIFRVAEEISSASPDLTVIKYSREQSGVFVFEFLARDLAMVSTILAKSSTVAGVTDVFIRDISVISNDRVLISTQLSITNSGR